MNKIFSVEAESSYEFTEKKSRFIGYCRRVNNIEEANDFISSIKAKHYDAKHNVYAYVIGDRQEIRHSSDDGEPSGTGGRPVLECIVNSNLTNVCIVVTRYFGGVLLGTGGLCRAYGGAAKGAIDKGIIINEVSQNRYSLTVSLELSGKLQNIMMHRNMVPENIVYTDKAEFFFLALPEEADAMETTLKNELKQDIKLCATGETVCFLQRITP